MELLHSFLIVISLFFSPPDKNDKITGTKLDEQQQLRLSAAFNQVYGIAENQRIVDYLAEADASLVFRMGNQMANPGAYDRANKVVYFRKEQDINYHVLLEELFHAYQDQVISIGTDHFDQAHINIEFEAKLYSDIIQMKYTDYLVGELGLPLLILGSSSEDYISWIGNITEGHTTYPTWNEMKSRYYEFLEEFSNEKTAYGTAIDLKDQPISLFSVFNPDTLIMSRK
ncbi:MAG: hypothetical protein WBA74_11165 [Cyclobacteriaceae bacterium]